MKKNINEKEENNCSDENSNNICNNLGERITTKEIIIKNKEEYKRKNENDLEILKIEENNFVEKKFQLDDIDLLKIKKIKFKNINNLFLENLLIFKKYDIKNNSNGNEQKANEESEKESDGLNLEEIIFKNCTINDINFSNLFPMIKKFKLIN